MSLSEPQNMIEFITLVANMRDAQKRYFKSRTQASLIESKILERKVDLALKRQNANSVNYGFPPPEKEAADARRRDALELFEKGREVAERYGMPPEKEDDDPPW